SCTTGRLGQAAVRRYQHCADPAGPSNCELQTAENRASGEQSRKKERRFNLETSQPALWRAWHFRVCRRRGFNRKLPGELFWRARDRGLLPADRRQLCLVLLG